MRFVLPNRALPHGPCGLRLTRVSEDHPRILLVFPVVMAQKAQSERRWRLGKKSRVSTPQAPPDRICDDSLRFAIHKPIQLADVLFRLALHRITLSRCCPRVDGSARAPAGRLDRRPAPFTPAAAHLPSSAGTCARTSSSSAS